jgi:hypothetical protein
MRYFKFIFIITLLCFFKIALSQIQSVNETFTIVDHIDSNLLFMLDDHINTLMSDSNTAILKYGTHIFLIAPKLMKNDGIPDRIIDSLYKEIDFPPPFASPGYSVGILSILDSCPAIRILDNYQNKYVYFKNNQKLIILSKLNINISTNGSIIQQTFIPQDNLSGLVASSCYLYTFEGIYRIETTRLKNVHWVY